MDLLDFHSVEVGVFASRQKLRLAVPSCLLSSGSAVVLTVVFIDLKCEIYIAKNIYIGP
jgi:hypothetical protein